MKQEGLASEASTTERSKSQVACTPRSTTPECSSIWGSSELFTIRRHKPGKLQSPISPAVRESRSANSDASLVCSRSGVRRFISDPTRMNRLCGTSSRKLGGCRAPFPGPRSRRIPASAQRASKPVKKRAGRISGGRGRWGPVWANGYTKLHLWPDPVRLPRMAADVQEAKCGHCGYMITSQAGPNRMLVEELPTPGQNLLILVCPNPACQAPMGVGLHSIPQPL